jgi:integrase
VKKVKRQADYLSMAEAQLVITQASEANELIRWLLALSVGVRQGEALGLNWKNVHLDEPNPHIYIVEQIQRQTGRGFVIKPPKHNSIRTIPLDGNMVRAFKHHKRLQAERRVLAGPLWNEQGFVFTGDFGNPVDAKKDRATWHSLLKAAGVRKVRLHEARHTAATLMLYLKSTMHTVSNVLGHSSISITDEIYAHVLTESIGEAVSGLSTQLLYRSK